MKRHNNKTQERKFAEVFRSAFSDFPEGELVLDHEQERPDLILKTADRKIGIEVTRILHEELRRGESECERMVAAARAIYEQRNLPNLHVAVHVGRNEPFNMANRPRFASTLANLVAANIPGSNGLLEVQNDWSDAEVFPYEIDSILILRNPVLTVNHWNAGQAGFILENFIEALQRVLDSKESRFVGYDTSCDEQWLLIVAENGSPSAAFDPSTATLAHSYTSSFDRVFFLDLFKSNVRELNIRPSGNT
jgi:hypothetical protein